MRCVAVLFERRLSNSILIAVAVESTVCVCVRRIVKRFTRCGVNRANHIVAEVIRLKNEEAVAFNNGRNKRFFTVVFNAVNIKRVSFVEIISHIVGKR